MIIFSKFVCGGGTVSEALRSTKVPSKYQERNDLLRFSTQYRPIVVWNMTTRCNLKCQHCYINAGEESRTNELTTHQAKKLLDDLVQMGVPLVLFSGGEPFLRPDFDELVKYARSIGLRVSISTNGTLIDKERAAFLADQEVSYVGVSLDAAHSELHDQFRCSAGAFDRALEGLKNCREQGLKTGVRITVTKKNYQDVPVLFNKVKNLGIPRFCLYYLVPTGRGKEIANLDLDDSERGEVFDFLFNQALEEGPQPDIEILTTDGPFDGALLIERLKKETSTQVEDLQKLMTISGGCSAGEKIANIGPTGEVHPCQFWTHESLGNVTKTPFSQIWNNSENPLLEQLRSKEENLEGKCGDCDYKSMCKGCRLRALHSNGNIWAPDPACPYNPSPL